MAVNIEEIHELKEFLVKTLHSNTRSEQGIDQEFYDDAFKVPQLSPVNRPSIPIARTGKAARVIDSPTEHIITRNPQVLKLATGRENVERTSRVLTMLNQQWIPLLKRQNPNPFKESARKILLRGESWYEAHSQFLCYESDTAWF